MRLRPRDEASHASAHNIRPTNATSSGDPGLITDPGSASIPLPHPFDTSLGNNFTAASCPRFFNSFLNDESFQNCLPFSLLLQTSNGFFMATRSAVRLTQTLDATCDVDFNHCSAIMAGLAEQIQSSNNCGADLEMQNPQVVQAYNGLIAYDPLYKASCLTDSDGNYCFTNAVTNASAPSSSYIYYLPLAVELPAGTQPTCDKCLDNTMSIFATYASNSSHSLNGDYATAAQQIDMTCGPRFAAEAAAVQSSAASSLRWDSVGFRFLPVAIALSFCL